MKMRREHFNKYKEKIWLINIGVDKYIWIKKPKYIISKIEKILLSVITLPFMIFYVVGLELLDLVKEIGISTWEWIKDTVGDFIDIFPSYIEITDESIFSESKLKIPKKNNIDSKQK